VRVEEVKGKENFVAAGRRGSGMRSPDGADVIARSVDGRGTGFAEVVGEVGE
jgi:hypothetical protein